MKILQKSLFVALTFLLATCDIKDDIADPIIHGHITAFEVEGQCDANGRASSTPIIDKQARTITLYVNDMVNVADLRVTKVTVDGTTENMGIDYTELPLIHPNPDNGERFPEHGFNDTTGTLNIRMDFTRPVEFKVSTLQDYIWTVTVNQVVKREIEVENQVGDAIIDPNLCNAIVYVNKEKQSLRRLKFRKFSLGGEHGCVTPDPTKEEESDFYYPRTFEVTTGWGAIQAWTVTVCGVVVDKDESKDPVTITPNAWSNFAMLNATITPKDEAFKTTLVYGEWRRVDESEWTEIPYYEFSVEGSDGAYKFSTTLKGLTPNTEYEFQLRYEDAGEEKDSKISFTTEQQTPLYNGGFEHWWLDGKVAYPNEQGVSFWDTSNPGGASFGGSNTTETTSVVHSGSKAAMLQSQYIVIKFAAASLYTGAFGQLVGTSGAKLNWGVPFTTRPTALKGYMQYAPVAINREGSNLPADAPAKGQPDQCGMYCALLSEALVVDNTDMGTFPDWETDPRVIAYGALPAEQNVHSSSQWKKVNIPLVYHDLSRKPTHLLVVFSASKYGDYFHGGEGSTLYLDDFELVYGDSPLVK